MKNIFKYLNKNDIGEPPWNYYFLQNLDESEYPKYLKKIYKYRTGENLNLKHPKSFNEKIQWIKLYGVTPLIRDCTDKVKVRDYVNERIGEEYLKPVMQIIGTCHSENVENQNVNSVDFQVVQNLKEEKSKRSQQAWCRPELVSGSDVQEEKMLKHACINNKTGNENINYTAVRHDIPIIDFITKSTDVSSYFDRIDFDKLPNSFVIKCNHGCKWQYLIKDKEEFLKNKRLYNETRKQITGWLEQEYWCWSGFELQYKGLEPKIIIEKFIGCEKEPCQEIEVYCFLGKPKIIKYVYNDMPNKIGMYDENLNNIDFKFFDKEILVKEKAKDCINQTIDLSAKLCITNYSPSQTRGEGVLFNFVRVDWLVFQNKLFFNELTFTPNSGLTFLDKKWNLQMGEWFKL